MNGQYIAVLTTLLILVTTGHELKLWNERNCPSNYSVYSSEGKPIGIEIRRTPDPGCNHIVENKRNRKELSDLKPIIQIVFKNGQYVANISWEYTVQGNKKLPKQFLLNMTFYEEYVDMGITKYRYSNVTCVSIVITSGRRVLSKQDQIQSTKVKFYFDCLPMQGPDHFGLRAEVWTFPQKSTRRCRSVRSLPDGSLRCGIPGIRCSSPYNFVVALDSHKYRQCACYQHYHGYPNVTWQRDSQSKQFKITITNMSPFLSRNELQVTSADEDDLNQFIENLEPNNGSVDVYVYTARLSEENNFDVYVRLNATLYTTCQEPDKFEKNYKDEIDMECDYEGSMFVMYHVKFEADMKTSQGAPIHKKKTSLAKESVDIIEKTKWNDVYLIAILAAVIIPAIITSICFVYRRRNSYTSLSSPVPSNVSGNEIELTSLRPSEECVDTTLDDPPSMKETLDQNITVDKLETELVKLLDKNDNNRNQLLTHKTCIEKHFCTSNTEDVPVLILLGDSKSNFRKVEQLTSILLQKVKLDIVHIKPNCETNYQKCSCYSNNVILIMSEGLNEICRNSAKMSRTQQGNADHYCDVLRTVKKYEPRMQQRLCIHLVSFCAGDYSSMDIRKFLHDHDLGERSNCYPYYFVGDCVDSLNNKDVLDMFTRRICDNTALKENRPLGLKDVSDRTSLRTTHQVVPAVDIQAAIMRINVE